MTRRIAIVAALLALFAALAGCSGGPLPAAGNVSNADAQKVIDAGAVILDVRTPAEFQGGFIAEAQNIPVDELATSLSTLDKSKPVLVYCATGSRSVTAVQILKNAGFEKVYNLTAGIAGWAQEGLDVTTDQQVAAGGGEPTPSASGLPVMYEFYTDW
ncbi:MAG TPA: rhodanese-like domain-containing protein [Coriobacteriia bacterium]|nr:rhodanese-like domain-containing protein [Coriobacteriia bacterium]